MGRTPPPPAPTTGEGGRGPRHEAPAAAGASPPPAPPSAAALVVARLSAVAIPARAVASGPAAQVAAALEHLTVGGGGGAPSRGSVLIVPSHLEYVASCPYSLALGHPLPFVRRLAAQAYAMSTHAIVSADGDASLFASTASEGGVLALLATITDAGGQDAKYWFELLQHQSGLLPHLDAALALRVQAVEEGLDEPDSPSRTPQSILNRARALLHISAIQRALASRGGSPLPADLLRRTLLRQSASFTGAGGQEPKADVMDFEAMLASAGWARVSRSACGYPFAPRPNAPGVLPLTDVNYLVRSYLALVGDVADDDPLWTVAQHLFEHEVLFVCPAGKPSLDELVEASWHPPGGGVGGPLRLGRPTVPGYSSCDPIFMAKHCHRLITDARFAIGMSTRFCCSPVLCGPLLGSI